MLGPEISILSMILNICHGQCLYLRFGYRLRLNIMAELLDIQHAFVSLIIGLKIQPGTSSLVR